MTLGEHGDRVYAPLPQRFLKLAAPETGADAADMFRGVEIEMDLACAQ
jgi:hypothetical protein